MKPQVMPDKDHNTVVKCPHCGCEHKKRRNGNFCNMSCYYCMLLGSEGRN